MAEQKNLKFFITHSWRDNAFAERLANDLRARGFGGFLDIYSVKAGDDIPREINRGLEACDVYIPILSSESLKSKWCEREINAALMLSADRRRGGRPRIIPVLADDCLNNLPPLLKPLLSSAFSENYLEALTQLLEGIEKYRLEREHKARQKRVIIGAVATSLIALLCIVGIGVSVIIPPTSPTATWTSAILTLIPLTSVPTPTATPTSRFPIPTPTLTLTPHPLTATPTYTLAIGTRIIPITPRPSPTQTPGGLTGKIAFYSKREVLSQVYHAQIYAVTVDGTYETLLSEGKNWDDGSPSWSPDGKKFVFDTNRDGNWEIYVANSDGSEPKNISNHPSNDQQPAWSPNGQYIAFFSDRRISGIPDLYVMGVDGLSPIQITYGEWEDGDPAWSYDSSRIAFNRNKDKKTQIYLVDIYDEKKNLFHLTEKVKTQGDETARCASPTWSPDGQKLAFQSDAGGWWQIYQINVDGSDPKRLTYVSVHDCRPYWSPDGYFIAFDSGDCEKDSQLNQIYTMNADGTNRQPVTKSKGRNVAPAWWMPR